MGKVHAQSHGTGIEVTRTTEHPAVAHPAYPLPSFGHLPPSLDSLTKLTCLDLPKIQGVGWGGGAYLFSL